MRKLILKCNLSPGDILTLTVAVKSLHDTYPGDFLTDIRTPCPAIWEHNPHIVPIADDDPEAQSVQMNYPSIDQSNQEPIPFVGAYTQFLGEALNWPLKPTVSHPVLYLSDDEKSWMDQVQQYSSGGKKIPFWMINAGCKSDFTAKQWPIEHFQEVVDCTRGLVQWVQIGEAGHNHVPLTGAINLIGKTDLRQVIRLAYHARGGLGPVTMLQHLCAAWSKPYICLLGGREPNYWTTYPYQHTLHSIGQLPCCIQGACWRSRVVKLNDGDVNDDSLCDHPVLGLQRPSAKCMAMISPEEVVVKVKRILSA